MYPDERLGRLHRSGALAILVLLVVAAGCAREGHRGAGERTFGAPVKGASIDAVDVGRAPREQASAAAGGEKIALIVGVSTYADAEIPRLRFARSDAEQVYASIVDEAGLGYAARNVKFLADERATRAEIQKAIVWLNEVALARPVDTGIVYFAGQGAVALAPPGEP